MNFIQESPADATLQRFVVHDGVIEFAERRWMIEDSLHNAAILRRIAS